MSDDAFFRLGECVDLGSHAFTADEIKTFAAKFDPQPFHLDEKAAEASVFGALCASGWHTASTWMRLNIAEQKTALSVYPGKAPVMGPSPGVKTMKWLKPAYAGREIRYTRTVSSHRALATRPGWRVLIGMAEAFDGDTPIMQFETAVLFRPA